MQFLACIKQVPDVTVPVRIQNGALHQESNRMILNAYDASAVEAALELTETHGGSLEVVLIGPEKARETLRKALAMGASRGYHIVCDDISEFDSAVFAAILSRFVDKTGYDVILTGKQSQDTDAGLTGSMLAESRNLPYVSNAVSIVSDGTQLTVTRQGDTGQEIIDIRPPCLITCSNDMNNPRIPNLKGIMQSKKKPVDVFTLSDLELDVAELLSSAQKTILTGFREAPGRKPGKKLEDDPDQLARKLIELLENEARVL